ncbi:AtpZ/AtpI family protein [Propionispora hippei]|uniref:F0F1-ATPase subunit Ca2+/Mg2+ transporter n=1 Tax=Propionispora hippei DSM 15287 TaxID=1123003 RepID=A0A1M6BR84_9FIRM|nr:AtpZ/AtpI family protein [Propionispora hippei]SHI51104.1 Putative F0F1-ATPase subunit Ca2+/Mg2+ transporter [Propionispora hippei DSM 15287]
MNKKDKQPGFSALGIATTLSFTLVANIAVGIFLGRLLDNWLDCAPWASVAGIVLGMVSGLWAIYKKAVKY